MTLCVWCAKQERTSCRHIWSRAAQLECLYLLHEESVCARGDNRRRVEATALLVVPVSHGYKAEVIGSTCVQNSCVFTGGLPTTWLSCACDSQFTMLMVSVTGW